VDSVTNYLSACRQLECELMELRRLVKERLGKDFEPTDIDKGLF
jgi:hypothetical protein